MSAAKLPYGLRPLSKEEVERKDYHAFHTKLKGPKPTNADKIDRALRMVAESRPRMNKLTREQRAELEASGRATMAEGKKPKQAQAVKAKRVYACSETMYGGESGFATTSRRKWGGMKSPVFVLPADAASVERMLNQAAQAVSDWTQGENCEPSQNSINLARAAIASLGITSAKGRK